MKTKKGLAVLLAVMLAFSCLSLTAFASEDDAFQVITPEGTITGYKTVKDARSAMQDGYTLKLLKDYVSTEDYNYGISIDKRNITIDLNGYSVTSNNTKAPNGYAIKLEQTYGGAYDNTVTIKNSGSKQSVLSSSNYQVVTGSGNSNYNQVVKFEGDIVFQNISGEEPLGIELGTGAKLLDTESARALIPNGGFSVKEADGSSYIYGNLANAAGRSADGNIVLLNDYVGSDKIASGQKDGALDLDGHTYTYTGGDAAIDVNYPGVTLTVKNGSVVVTDESADGAVLVGAPDTDNMNNRGLVLDNVQLTVPGNAYGIVTNGTETGNTVTLKNNSVLNVKNGFGIYFPSDGEVIIDNSTINAKHVGVQLCAGDLTVTGESAITVTGQPQEKTEGDGPVADGAAVSIINRDGYQELGTVKIESGDFNAAADVTAVKAYSFNNTDKTEDEWAEAGNVVGVTGGSFSSNIAENIVNSDMQATTTSGGETRFVVGKTAVENAIQALKSGDKITFKKVADDAVITVPENVEITNSTGKDITVNGDTFEVGETTTAHVWDTEYTIDKEATCTEDGSKSIHCTTPGCTAKKDVQIIPAAHKLENVAEQQATCKAEGIKAHQHCTVCGKDFIDGVEKTVDELKITKLAHTYVDGKCTVCGESDSNYNPGTMNPEQMIPSQPNDTNKPDNRMDNPETGDGSNLTLPIIILSVSGIGLSGIFIYLRKRKCNR